MHRRKASPWAPADAACRGVAPPDVRNALTRSVGRCLPNYAGLAAADATVKDGVERSVALARQNGRPVVLDADDGAGIQVFDAFGIAQFVERHMTFGIARKDQRLAMQVDRVVMYFVQSSQHRRRVFHDDLRVALFLELDITP